ncbi:HemK/PrmC family methyltransferase, partial [Desulfobacterales bacterium HSG16]|nr:HemK/PrmC family methyltransferase [Desulfobacterales bacterium HSG16]
RPDTECLVEEALKIMDKKADSESDENQNLLKILELGTGSGAIILSLASERPDHLYFASDKSEKSLEVAKKNYTDGKIAADIKFFVGNWFDPIADASLCFDMIASNPPYIPTSDITGLAPEINRYEPALALDGGKDGLDAVRHIIGNAPSFLAPGGHLLLEIGYDQGAAVKKLAEQSGMYDDAAILKDYSRNDRVARLKIK